MALIELETGVFWDDEKPTLEQTHEAANWVLDTFKRAKKIDPEIKNYEIGWTQVNGIRVPYHSVLCRAGFRITADNNYVNFPNVHFQIEAI